MGIEPTRRQLDQTDDILELVREGEALTRKLTEVNNCLKSKMSLDFMGNAVRASIALYHLSLYHKALDDEAKRAYHFKDLFDKGIVPKKMEAEGLDLLRVPEVARSFSLQQRMSASMVDKEKTFDWLRDIGQEALIQETVNASSLSALCRNLIIDEGIDPPADAVKVSTYQATSINKYTPKG